MTRYEIERLRRESADLLEEVEISDLQDAAAAARTRVNRIAEATERTAANTTRQVFRSKLSVAERVKLVGQIGMDRYLALPWSAR